MFWIFNTCLHRSNFSSPHLSTPIQYLSVILPTEQWMIQFTTYLPIVEMDRLFFQPLSYLTSHRSRFGQLSPLSPFSPHLWLRSLLSLPHLPLPDRVRRCFYSNSLKLIQLQSNRHQPCILIELINRQPSAFLGLSPKKIRFFLLCAKCFICLFSYAILTFSSKSYETLCVPLQFPPVPR